MEVKAGKDKIILVDLDIFEKKEGGFEVSNSTEQHGVGIIHDVPEAHAGAYTSGEKIILRARATFERMTIEGVEYTFIQPLDILCKIEN